METKDKLKRILTEWSQFELPQLHRRDFDPSYLEGAEILSLIGARRSGKTSLCHQVIGDLKKSVSPDNIVYLNLEDERLHPLQGDELTLFWDVYLELFSVDFSRRIYLFVDEIQNVPNWSKWARRITEQHHNVKIVVTGSSSKLLSREIATELRGRTLSFIVYPFSFSEYLRAKGISFERGERLLYSVKERASIKRQFNHYLKEGGFPATLESPRPRELLNEYYKVMFYRDLVDRFKIKNIRLFEDYLTLVMDQTAAHFSISSTAEKLKLIGYSLSKNTLVNFSRYAAEVFLIFEVKKYSYRVSEQLRATRKVYAIDPGLVQAVRFAFSEDYGRMLENVVFLALKKRGGETYYHKGEKECDFLSVEDRKVTEALQVCKSLRDPITRKREVDGLTEALSRYHLKEGLILTEDEAETLEVAGKRIKILPVWYWLL